MMLIDIPQVAYRTWDALLTMITLMSENNENAYVEQVEVVRGESDE